MSESAGRVVLLVASSPEEAVNDALELARRESRRRPVVLVDIRGDLRRFEALSNADDEHGASDHFQFGISWDRITRPVTGAEGVSVITSGSDEITREEYLTSPRWDTLIDHYRSRNAVLVLVAKEGTPWLEHLASRVDRVVKSAAVEESEAHPAHSGRRWAMIGVGTLVAAVLVAVFWKPNGSAGRSAVATGTSAGVIAPVAGGTSTAADFLRIINPYDSAVASAYSVEIAVLNTRSGALMRVAELSGIPGTTISPMASDAGDTWYRVVSGALPSRESADTLQLRLAETGIQLAGTDRIVRLPLAMRLSVHAPNAEAAAEAELTRYTSNGLPAYLLAQADGSLIIYAGAFEGPAQAAHLAGIMSAMGIPPRLAYRTGR